MFLPPTTTYAANATQFKTAAPPHKRATTAQDIATVPHLRGPPRSIARTVSVLGARWTCDAHAQQHARWPREDADNGHTLSRPRRKAHVLAAEPQSHGPPPLSRSTTTTSKS